MILNLTRPKNIERERKKEKKIEWEWEGKIKKNIDQYIKKVRVRDKYKNLRIKIGRDK